MKLRLLAITSLFFLFSCGESEEEKSAKINAEKYAKKYCECQKIPAGQSGKCVEELGELNAILNTNYETASEAGVNMDKLKEETKKIMDDIMAECK